VISVPQLKLPVGKEERWLIFKYPVLQGRLVCTVSNSGVFLDNREASEGLSPRVVRISFTLDNLAKILAGNHFPLCWGGGVSLKVSRPFLSFLSL
jgi:hypothetical protein